MAEPRDALERIAAALERLAPNVAPPQDWQSAPAFVWDGAARAVRELDALPLDMLRGVEEQKAALHANIARLSNGAAAHDMLLWGARGMGKSALVRACVADVQHRNSDNLRLVQVSPDALANIGTLIGELAEQKHAIILFIDDLGFGAEQKQEMLALRSLLDGGLVPRPAHIRVAVTSNRRAINARDVSENGALHERDERDDGLALADRFGLKLGFHPCDRETYLGIVRAYTDPLSLEINEEEALAWAIERGNRSGRTAYQFATELAGRAGNALP